MTSLSDVVLATGFLVFCLNAALGSVVACAIAVILSRRSTWSLPVRHALLAAALAASVMAPLVIPLFHVPSVWAIGVSETSEPFQQPTRAVAVQPTGNIRQPPPEEATPLANSIPVVEAERVRSTTVAPAHVPPVAVAPESNPLAPVREQPALATTEWARILGSLLCGIWFAGIAAGMLTWRDRVRRPVLRRWIQDCFCCRESRSSLAAAAPDDCGRRVGDAN